MTNTTELPEWVSNAPDTDEANLRKTVHICLYAIASNPRLRSSMYIKGGILLAVKYHSDRFTKDIDFSTQGRALPCDFDLILNELANSLINAEEALPYDIATCINSHKVKPKNKNNPSFPALKIKVGYAVMGSNQHKTMLRTNQSTSTLAIDYSFNEHIETHDTILIEGTNNLFAYSLTDLIAEKYRAVLQQPERNRNRRQDIYDLWLIIQDPDLADSLSEPATKALILKTLLIKCKSRGITPIPGSLDDKDIYERSGRNYEMLAHEIKGELPEFDAAFSVVRSFYAGLKWGSNPPRK